MAANATQASIMLANYAIVDAKYKAMLRWMMGGDVRPEEIDSYLAHPLEKMPAGMAADMAKRIEAYQNMLADRSALEIISPINQTGGFNRPPTKKRNME